MVSILCHQLATKAQGGSGINPSRVIGEEFVFSDHSPVVWAQVACRRPANGPAGCHIYGISMAVPISVALFLSGTVHSSVLSTLIARVKKRPLPDSRGTDARRAFCLHPAL